MTETTNTWTERKMTLKREIYDYFIEQGATKEVIKKACAHVKMWGEIQIEMVETTGGDITPALPSDDYITENFRPQHRAIVASWINRYAQLHKEALEYLEAQRNFGAKTNWARDDFELEDWESTQPDGEIQVHADGIKVFAFGFTEGFADRLPKQGKKSIGRTNGGYEWNYSLSSLEALQKLDLPILYAIDYAIDAQR